MEDAVAEEYKSSLADLTCNSKPYINMLTILAEENIKYAPQLVKTITDHVLEVAPEAKLPCLYLVDSIIKNVRKPYLNLFSVNIVSIFASVFEKVDENTRMLLYKLRQTWNEIFTNKILYALDIRVKEVDPAWPVTAQPPTSIHINPKFLGGAAASAQKSPDQQPLLAQKEEAKLKAQQNEVLKQLFVKQEQLRLLEQKKRELATKQFLSSDSGNLADIAVVSNIQPRGIDPRVAAKLNPKLSQRDPRLQKVVVATVLKKNLAQSKADTAKTKEATQVPPVAKITPLSVPSVSDSCDRLVGDLAEAQGSSKEVESAQSLSEHETENKGVENTDATGSSRKSRSDKEVPAKREQSSSPSSRTSGRKKRKTEDNKKEESEKEPSLKKSPKGKGSKKKDSPKKSLSTEGIDGKKQQPSRLPVDKVENKALNWNDYSEKNKETEVENIDLKQADTKKQEQKEEDTDLRKISKDEVRTKHEIESESKENFDEPPSKKQKEMKRKDSDTDSLFGHEDQDYRQLSKNGKFSHLKGWAMYKAAHPEEFKVPRRQLSYNSDMENQQPRFVDHEKNNNDGKMRPQHYRDEFDHGPGEYDRLGRLRLSKMRRNQKFGYPQPFSQREEAFRLSEQGPFSDKRLQDVFFTSVMGDPKDMLRQAEEQYRLGRINEKDFSYIQKELERMWTSEAYRHFKAFRGFPEMPNYENMKVKPLVLNMNKDFMHHSKGRAPENITLPLKDSLNQGHPMPPPAVRTFRLDNQSRTIHFIDDKAIILMDNDEPRELTFRGEPTPVFIQGLKPITLRFDGRPVEFQLDGQIYSMKFGAPSRELYINNRPYEGKFGGPPFDVMLNGRVHRVSLGGPPPQVQVGEHPVHDLYRKFLAATRGNPELSLPPGNNRTHAPPPEILRDHSNVVPFDVDMRSEHMPVRNSGDMRDVDWRQGAASADVREPQRGYAFSSNGTPPHTEEQSQRMDPTLRNPSQVPNEWNRRDEPSFSSFPHDQNPLPHPDWRKFPPPLHDVKMPYSPHHTPPREGHPNEWEQPPVSRSYDQPGQNSYEPSNCRWIPGDFSHEGSRTGPPPPLQPPPPPVPQVSEPSNMYTMQRNSPQQYEAYPEYHGNEPRIPSSAPIHPPLRPPFNPHLNRPEFTERAAMIGRLPRPPMPPWIQNQRPSRPDVVRLPLLPPPPRPPMHMKMPESFIRALPPVSDTHASEPVTTAQPSTSAVVPGLHSTSGALPPPPLPPLISSDPQVGSTEAEPVAANHPVLNFDISTLFEKLVAAGIISKPDPDIDAKKSPKEEEEEEEKDAEGKKGKEKDPNEEPVPPIELKLECLKVRYSGVTSALYRGSQCASCGMRFKEIHGERYSRHLDWHFRVNRREKDGVKKAFSRKWYYEVEDWIQFEEFEDFEERARSFFELQADEQFQMEAEVEVPSVPVSGQETEACVVCGELFQLFWVEEEEEWHLRNAVRHEGQAYHPSCYEDYKKSLEVPVKEEVPGNEDAKDDVANAKDSATTDTSEITMVEVKKEPEDMDENNDDDDAVAEVVKMLADATVDDYEQRNKEEELKLQLPVVKEEPKEEEEELQGKPGEEEIIGVITDADNENECKPVDESEKVVFKSGGIVMKVRAESLKPASPCPENNTGKDSDLKGEADESEGEEEFRPPTPDPRFQVLPPVQRGTELSGLCCIM